MGLRRLGRGLLADMAFSVRDVDIGVDGSEMCNFRYWGEDLDFWGGASDLSEMSRLKTRVDGVPHVSVLLNNDIDHSHTITVTIC